MTVAPGTFHRKAPIERKSSMSRLRALAFSLCLLITAAGLPQAHANGSRAACAGETLCQQRFVRIGGIEQWISIAGESRANPVLLMVHGGPGIPQWPDAARFKPWEKYFTVVLWDQRGAGHTFGRYGTRTPDVTLQRIVKDGVDLSRYLCRTLGKRKIIVLGHSWGALVGVHMAQQAPQLIAAYVGTGQVSDFRAGALMQYRMILAQAHRDDAVAELKALQALGRPDPGNSSQYAAYRKYIPTILASQDLAFLRAQRRGTPSLLAAYPKGGQDLLAGARFSRARLWPYVMKADLPETVPALDTAFILIQGQNDVLAPTRLAANYLHVLKAPYKKLVIIPHAGHFALMTNPRAFLHALLKEVRPVAIARGA